MNKYLKIVLPILASLIYLSSCIKTEFNEPEKAVYNPGLTATTTIEDLLDLYEGSLTYLDTAVIISGTVIANDKTGNFYKQMVIQDSTAGIAIDLDLYEFHNLYHIGDLVFIKCQGLYLGDYGGVVKLGSIYEDEVGRISEAAVFEHIFKSDGGKPIKPKELSLVTPNIDLLNQLVVINNAQFSLNALGNTYADAEYQTDGEYTVEDCDGFSMIVRTSGYADFARDTIPWDNGQMIAVLGRYNGEFQLTIRDTKEITFNEARCGDVYYHSFKNDGINAFTAYNVTGTEVWTYSSSYGAVMSGYTSGSHANEDWLISPAINIAAFSDLVLRFRHSTGYTETGFQNDLKVFICDDYDGTSNPNTVGTWTELIGITYPTSQWGWVDSGDLTIPASYNNAAHLYVAFKYTSSTSRECTWEIDNFAISIP